MVTPTQTEISSEAPAKIAVAARFPASRVTVEKRAAANESPKPKTAIRDRFQISGRGARTQSGRAEGMAGLELVIAAASSFREAHHLRK